MITPEERKRRTKERKEKAAQLAARFPAVMFCHENNESRVQLFLAPGNDWELRVRKHGPWVKQGEWEEHSIVLSDPHELARLIRGLVARFNAMAGEVNTEVAGTKMQRLRRLESDAQP
ncbi:MAG TPA: hypothetical protein VFA33_05730 [Bryobacteraceae bacterium]|nr:hypothetical protein [Bryobacteraceae bacterium]